jgi:hemerythrin-like domain-containing protein
MSTSTRSGSPSGSPSGSQVSLPGQAHAADGPHDQTGMYVMHHAFRRDLANLEAGVRQTPLHAAETWAALRERWARFGHVLHHHHQIEDTAIWPVLVRHAETAGDTEALSTLQAMEDEHEGIDPALTAVTEGFTAMVEHPCADHRNALDVHVTATRAALLQHLAHEETEALPYLQRVMTEEEFAASERAAAKGYPPRLLPFLVAWAFDEVPDEVATRFLTQAGVAYRVLLWLVRPRFRRQEGRAFRYV